MVTRWMVEIKVEITMFFDPEVESREEAVDATVRELHIDLDDLVVVDDNTVTVVRADPVGPRKSPNESMM